MRAAARSLDSNNANHIQAFKNMLHSKTSPEEAQSLMQLIKDRSSKKLNETTTSAVGGLGYNSGNPAAAVSELQRYADTNAAVSDQISQSLSKELSNSQNKLSKMIGFKEYQPRMSREKSLTYWDYDENGNPLLIDAIKRRVK